ncbi:hypothetical protein [Dactylosporangium sp. CA-092794]|uniref:hypothetical protein n=1 Tax=Dactylosporangium sp. CA-092794 TaxID=3239929 RepID=UPI003D94B86F
MIRRIAPAAGLFFLAPLVAEFLLGNLPITMLFALVALAPMYGGGALLIRELARRRSVAGGGPLDAGHGVSVRTKRPIRSRASSSSGRAVA